MLMRGAKFKALAALVATVGAMGSGVLVASTASAATAPDCMTVTTWSRDLDDYAKAYDGCGATKRIRMIWAFDADGNCASRASGNSYTESRPFTARFDRLDAC
ncbi:hypothetical protein ACGIF2_02905 [Cellulomonas sp. P22]|uniref:hypothetical protein n=1 Tax=Cellulomonas sp. P22 TaxID=3373189 RepID=UPI0037A62134